MTLVGPDDGSLILLPGLGGPSLDPLLAEAQVYIDATAGTGVNEGTAGSDLDATGTFAALGPSSWTGDALLGYMTRDSAYNQSETWFTDLDVSATFSIPAHANNNPSGQWAEILHIPKTGGGGATEWFEFGVVFRDNGDLWIGFDFQSGSETSVGDPTWVSGEVYSGGAAQPLGVIGDWRDGLAEATWRLTIVASTGAVTLRKDGVTVVTDTIGACAFPEPANDSVVQVGPFQYTLPLKSVSLKDGIGGAEIIGWDADTPTGWTAFAADGSAITAPPASAAIFARSNNPITLPDDPALDVAADEDATFAAWATVTAIADDDGEAVRLMQRATGTIGAGGEGVEIIDIKIAAYSSDFAGALLSDGSDNGFVVGAHWTVGAHLFVLNIDRDTDVATLYIDGASHATADISAVGAVDPAAALTLGAAFHHAFAKWDRVLTADERAALPYLLA